MSEKRQEVVRYVVNGVFATIAHFTVLTLNLTVLKFESAGLANLLAAIFGITVSYLGSRYYVFRSTDEYIAVQVARFGILYGFIAVLHGAILWVWSDLSGFDYRIGFLLATVAQVSLSYFGNKYLVFRT